MKNKDSKEVIAVVVVLAVIFFFFAAGGGINTIPQLLSDLLKYLGIGR